MDQLLLSSNAYQEAKDNDCLYFQDPSAIILSTKSAGPCALRNHQSVNSSDQKLTTAYGTKGSKRKTEKPKKSTCSSCRKDCVMIPKGVKSPEYNNLVSIEHTSKTSWNSDTHTKGIFDSNLRREELSKKGKHRPETGHPKQSAIYGLKSRTRTKSAVHRPSNPVKQNIRERRKLNRPHDIQVRPLESIILKEHGDPPPRPSLPNSISRERCEKEMTPRSVPESPSSPKKAQTQRQESVSPTRNHPNQAEELSKSKQNEEHRRYEEKDPVRKVFRQLDKYNLGVIDASQVYRGIQQLGLEVSFAQVKEFVKLITTGPSAGVSMEEWQTYVNAHQSAAGFKIDESMEAEDSFLQNLSDRLPKEDQVEERVFLSSNQSPAPSPSHVSRLSPSRSTPPYHSQKAQDPILLPHTMQSHMVQHTRHRSMQPSVENRFPSSHRTSNFQEEDIMIFIQNRIDELFGNVHFGSHTQRSNQQQNEAHEDPRGFIDRATSVVNQLKSGLYPLLQQAEESLSSMRQKHCRKLSSVLQKSEIQHVVNRSEDIANLVLEDLLLDTVEILSREEGIQEEIIQMEKENDTKRKMTQDLSQMLSEHESLYETYITKNGVNCLDIVSPPHLCEEIHEESNFIEESTDGVQVHESMVEWIETLMENAKRFERYREINEATLQKTGFRQAAVIEILEGMILADILDECQQDVESVVEELAVRLSEMV